MHRKSIDVHRSVVYIRNPRVTKIASNFTHIESLLECTERVAYIITLRVIKITFSRSFSS